MYQTETIAPENEAQDRSSRQRERLMTEVAVTAGSDQHVMTEARWAG
jgi:hypothetical protein